MMSHIRELVDEILSQSAVEREKEMNEKFLTEEKINKLLEFQNGVASERLTMINAIGTLAQKGMKYTITHRGLIQKIESNRQYLISIGSIQIAADFVKNSTNDEEIFQAIRAITNLCFDNGAARSIVIELGITNMIVSMMRTAKPSLLKVIAGYLTNISSDCSIASRRIVELDGHRILMDSLKSEDNSVTLLAVKAIGNLSITTEIMLDMVESGLLEKIIPILEHADDKLLYETFNVLSNVILESRPEFERFMKLNGPDALISILKRNNSIVDEGCEKMLKSLWDLLSGLFNTEQLVDLIGESRLVESVLEIFLDIGNLALHRQRAGEFISKASEYSSFLPLLESKIPEYVQFLKDEGDFRIRLSNAIILSNLACDSGICTQLFEYKVDGVFASILLHRMVYEESQSIVDAALNTEKQCFDLELKRIVASGLRNMSVVMSHKLILIDHGLIDVILEFFSSDYDVAIHKLLISLKLLLFSGDIAINALLNKKNLKNLLTLTDSREELKRKDHIFYESSRVFYVLINNSSTETLILALERHGSDIISTMSNLIMSKFEILNYEGAVGLKKLLDVTNDPKQLSHSIWKHPGLLSRISKIIKANSESSNRLTAWTPLVEISSLILSHVDPTEEELQSDWLPLTELEIANVENGHKDQLLKLFGIIKKKIHN